MDWDRGFRVQQKNEDAEAAVCHAFLLQKLSSHPIPLASPVPTMKSAEFGVDCLREYHGFLSGSGLW